jgi:predicted RNA binding protein YcfA (HicA-like mRNA interferase family)
MARLAGFSYREVAKRLRGFGFSLIARLLEATRFGSMNPLGDTTTIPNHPGDLPEGIL